MIPQKVHFITRPGLDDKVQEEFIRNFKTLHPEWSITKWDGVPQNMPEELLEVCNRNEGGIASEIIKLWLAYFHGGVVMDSDIWFLQPMNSLLDCDFFYTVRNGDPGPSVLIASSQDNVQLTAVIAAIAQTKFPINKPTLINSFGIEGIRLPSLCFSPFRSGSVAVQYVQNLWNGKAPSLPVKIVMENQEKSVFGVCLLGNSSLKAPSTDLVLHPPVNKPDPEVEASIMDMGISLGKSIVSATKDLLSGRQVLASPEEAKRRMTICRGNDFGKPKCDFFISESERCSKCGCYMANKTKIQSVTCPVGKW